MTPLHLSTALPSVTLATSGATGNPLALLRGSHGWTSAGVSVVIHAAATDAHRVEAAPMLLSGTGWRLERVEA
jgi:hypothetical protein